MMFGPAIPAALLIAFLVPAIAGLAFCVIWTGLYYRVFDRAPLGHILLLGFVGMAWFWLPACLVISAAVAPRDSLSDRVLIAGVPCVVGCALVWLATRRGPLVAVVGVASAVVVGGHLIDVPAAVLVMAGPVIWMGSLVPAALFDPVRAGVLSGKWRCEACGYDVRGVSSGICPECGESIAAARAL